LKDRSTTIVVAITPDLGQGCWCEEDTPPVTGSELIEASRGTAEGDLGPDIGVEQEASLSAHIHSRTPLGTGVPRRRTTTRPAALNHPPAERNRP
jgi:hypothetical protein